MDGEHKAMMDLWSMLCFLAAILFFGMHRGSCADIVGGKVSVPHSRPYMALLSSNNDFMCGGTLIRRNWVLTAAHCDVKLGDGIILGAHSLTKREKENQMFKITKRFCHPKYNKKTIENDIMLLKLNKLANITQAVKPIMLPRTYGDVMAGTQCLVVGWGSTKDGGKISDILHEAVVTVKKRHVCNNKKHYNAKWVTINMVCADGTKNHVKDTCEGDSGGPLICKGIQRGITSFGGKCGFPRNPGVYTHLTKDYLLWIKRIVGG